MKKSISILFICLLPFIMDAQTINISTSGNDAAGDGSAGNPYKSLFKASTVATSGTTIFVNAGTYIETQPAKPLVGVNINGADSATTIIKSHYVADWNANNPDEAAITLLSTSQGTNGNQTISNLTIDGEMVGTLGVLIKRRSNVTINHCRIQNFYINGLCLMGANDPYSQPTTYSAGNLIQNTTIYNCTDTAETYVGGGNINVSGQLNFHFHDFLIADTSRGPGANGDNIVGNWWNLGTHIYNGKSYKPHTGHDGYNFHFEMPNERAGAEIDHVIFYGGDCSIDAGNNGIPFDYSYAHSYHIHDCYFKDLNPQDLGDHGKGTITVEGTYVKNILVEFNTFDDCQIAFNLTDGNPGATNDSNIVFSNNLLKNVGQPVNGSFIDVIGIEKNHAGGTLQDVSFINNTFIPNPSPDAFLSFFRITCNNGSAMNNVTIANNICVNSLNYWFRVDNTGGSIDGLIVRNNNLYNNRSSNTITFSGNAVTNYVNNGNLTSNPLLNADGSLQAGSPAIGAAYPYGYGSDIGAIQSIAAPTANAGSDVTITLPTNSTALSGSGTDTDGTISSYLWTKISGGSYTISNASVSNPTLSDLVEGTYVFQLEVTDNGGATGIDQVTVIVNPAIVIDPPTISVSGDQDITATSTTVFSTAAAADGHEITYLWTKTSGGSATIVTPTTANTSITGLSTGTYVFRCTVTQDDSQTAYAEVTITVTASNVAPTANAGTDQVITLPTNSVSLTGSGTDTDGTISSYSWSKISGGAATFSASTSANTSVTGLEAGTYVFRLTVTDNNGATGTDDVQVTVNSAPVAVTKQYLILKLPTIFKNKQ